MRSQSHAVQYEGTEPDSTSVPLAFHSLAFLDSFILLRVIGAPIRMCDGLGLCSQCVPGPRTIPSAKKILYSGFS